MDKAPLVKDRYWSYCHADEDVLKSSFHTKVSLKCVTYTFKNGFDNVGAAPVNIPKPGALMVTETHLGCLCPKE